MNSRDYELELAIMRLRTKKNRRKLIIGLLVWCICIWGLLHRMYGISIVSGNSMRPAFWAGDVVIYRRRNLDQLSSGDVVILQSWLDKGKNYVKRVNAVPGDIISVDDKGYLEKNGEAVKEPEVLHGYQQTDSEIHYPYRLAENEYFCMGDNRPVSLDSRTFGPVSKSQMLGKVVAVVRFRAGLSDGA